MKIIEITRDQICEAIENEPSSNLVGPGWILGPPGTIRETRKTCTVCAVGAVLRSVLNPDLPNTMAHDLCVAVTKGRDYMGKRDAYAVEMLLASRKYMNALSVFFESTMRREGFPNVFMPARTQQRKMRHVKDQTLEFVKTRFPGKVHLSFAGKLTKVENLFDPQKVKVILDPQKAKVVNETKSQQQVLPGFKRPSEKKKPGKAARWRLSDIFAAIEVDCENRATALGSPSNPKVQAYKSRAGYANMAKTWILQDSKHGEANVLSWLNCWPATTREALGIHEGTPNLNASLFAQTLVAEARRLDVPRRG